MLSNSKRVVILLIFTVVYVLTPSFINTTYNQSLSEKPVVLLVGDFSSEDGFGSMLEIGIKCAAKQAGGSELRLEYHNVNVAESSDEKPSNPNITLSRVEEANLKRELTVEVATNNVVAIVAANTSQTAPLVLEFGRAFNIPVLLAVATNDSILQGYEQIAFRLPAQDTKQAEVIKNWTVQQNGRIGLVYDLSRYGIGLRDSLLKQIGPNNLVSFSMSTTTDLAGILKYGTDAGVKAWVVVGYRYQAVEFYSKKVALNVPGQVLFSDGAYGMWLSKLSGVKNTDRVYLSFPTTNGNNTTCSDEAGNPFELKGYADFGFDSHRLITAAINRLVAEGKNQKYELAGALRGVAAALNANTPTGQQYQFTLAGENERALFYVTEVSNGYAP
jgi:ABC-type branched-subunit amino acid transport system substrate-binding protein